MAETIYLLCGATSAICAALLLAGYRANRTRLLFYGSLCFAGLFANNALLFVDLVLVPATIDLSLLRGLIGLAAMATLLYGLIGEQR